MLALGQAGARRYREAVRAEVREQLAPVSPCYGAITGRNFIFGPFSGNLLEIISFITNDVWGVLPVISEQGGVLEITGRGVGNNREACWN